MNVRFLAAGLLVWMSSLALGADKEVEDLLAKMRAVYKGTKTAHVVLKSSNANIGKNLTIDLYYMRERKIKATIEGLPSMRGKTWHLTSNGDEVAYDDFSGNVLTNDFDLDDTHMPINLETMSFWDWERQLSTDSGANMEHSRFKLVKNEDWNKKKWTVLEETALGQNVFVRYFIEPSSSLIWRVLVYDLHKTRLRQETTVTKLDRNVRLNRKMFEIKDSEPNEPPAIRGIPSPAAAPIPKPDVAVPSIAKKAVHKGTPAN